MTSILILGAKEYPPHSGRDDPLPSGGMEAFVHTLVNEFSKKPDIKIKIITRKFKQTKSQEHMPGLEIYRVPWLSGFYLRNVSFNAFAFLKGLTVSCDLIFSQGLFASLFGAVLARIKREKIIMRPAGIAAFQPQYTKKLSGVLLFLERLAYRNGDHLVFVSEQEKINFEHRLGFLPRRFSVIPTGIELSSKEQKEKLRGKGLILTFVGRLIRVKGAHYLIEALQNVQFSNMSVLIVGEGPEKKELETMATKSGKKIVFLGHREDVRSILAVSDIFVLPSLSEGLPLTLLEAMYAECACIVTDIGLPVTHKETALVVPAQDPGSLANAIEELLQKPILRTKLQNAAKKFIAERHSIDRSAENYAQLFEKVK